MKNTSPLDATSRIANALVRPVLAIGLSKKEAQEKSLNVIRSLGTAAKVKIHIKGFLDFRLEHRLDASGPYLKEHGQEYLHFLVEEGYDQRYLNSQKRSLELVFGWELETVESETSFDLGPRDYADEEVQKIIAVQSEKNAFVTRLCFASGLRGHETLELRRVGERDRTERKDKPWDSRLFEGLDDFKIYVVKGKGGLVRHVAIPADLASELESKRLQSPRKVVDRKITYESMYDLGGGQAFSQSFCEANNRVGLHSRGAHGLRHSYAKRRFAQLVGLGLKSEDVLLILSQELGHFRPEIVLTYLR